MKCRIGIAMLIALALGVTNSRAQSMDGDTIDYFNMSLEDLMNMEIVAVSKKAENSFDAPLSSSIITKEEIINSGATTIEEAFRLVPGFIVREESNGNYDVHIRGNDNLPSGNFTFFTENSMSLIMVDGRKVFNNMNGGTFWEALPVSISDVERIEVIRGASTALYGPNAVSGVVNIITKKAEDKSIGIDGNFQFGNAATKIGDFALSNSFADNKVKTRISANFEQRERFTNDYYNWVTGTYDPYSELIDYINGNPTGEDDPTFADPSLAKDRYGVNAWLDFKASKKVNFAVSGGIQNSEAQSVFMEGSKTMLTTRESESFYFNTISNIHNLSVQLSGTFGTQDIYAGSGTSSKYDHSNFDVIAEYDYTINNLTLRPGVSYQSIVYDDTPYIPENKPGSGYLNDESVLTNFAYYLRGDYKASDKLRFIAAIRSDHYNKPDDNYLTYQLIGTYKPNDNNLFRASYSKANRGPVMVDFYASYSEGSMTPGNAYLQYLGNDHMKLPTSNVLELGYRGQLTPSLQVDIETYYSVTKDFPTFEPSIMAPTAEQPYIHIIYQYDNASVEAAQLGATASVLYKPTSKLYFKAFATLQNTELKNLQKKLVPMLVVPDNSVPGGPMFENPVYETVDQKHEQTPSFYGGFSVNYIPAKKLSVFAGLNYYSKQTYEHDYAYSQMHYFNQQLNPDYTGSGIANVKANTIVNAKVSYKVYKNNSVFVNARNLFNSTNRQFGFADEMGGLYLVGLNISL
ncbi:TonB-dependent receptor plug domain-containing protein [Carboxylicivirga sp. RSCT41]|uniref:TonB-dependent receptor plug domain-containing protein n=1 Tax=Carboxylicivirga agarovorans TaxID=3417570 RepID=UPI003D32E820